MRAWEREGWEAAEQLGRLLEPGCLGPDCLGLLLAGQPRQACLERWAAGGLVWLLWAHCAQPFPLPAGWQPVTRPKESTVVGIFTHGKRPATNQGFLHTAQP